MLQKIKDYALITLGIIAAVLSFLFLRRGEKIRDLQREQNLKELEKRLGQIKSEHKENEKEYKDALKEYYRLRDKYWSIASSLSRDSSDSETK